MKKITGKVVSLVLALALVVTSFSANFAFATTKSVTGSVSDTDNDSIYLCNYNDVYDSGNSVTLKSFIAPELDTKDHQDVSTDVDIKAISHASGDSLVKWDIDDDTGDATLTLKSSTKDGTEVLSILYESTYTNDDGDDVTVKARKNFTVHVFDAGDIVVGKVYTSDARVGLEMEKPSTFAQTAGSYVNVGVYKVGKDASTAKATYTAIKVSNKDSGVTAADVANLDISSDDLYLDTASTTALNTIAGVQTPVKVYVGKKSDRTKDAGVSNVTFTVKKYDTDSPYKVSTDSDDKYTLKSKIEKKVDVSALSAASGIKSFTIKKDDGKTKLFTGSTILATVTDTEIVFPATTTSVNADEGSVKKISGTVGALTVSDDATVGSVDIDEGTVSVEGGKVGDITTDGTNGSVTVKSGKAGNIDTTDATTDTVTINGGTVGTIDSDGTVDVESTDEDAPISTGKITALNVTAYASDAKVSIAGVKTTANDGTVDVIGDGNVSVGTVDLDYRTSTLQLGDDDKDPFIGTVVAPVNAVNGKLVTENEDSVATVTGSVDVDTISVGSDTKITFTGDIKVDTVDGDGTMKIAAGKLYVTGSVSSVKLKLSDKTLAAGAVVFKADTDTVDAEDFNTYGFTLTKSAGSSVDTFKIASLSFAGVALNKETSSIAKGYSETFTASAYPTGTALPTGATIKWELDGSDDVFTLTSTGNTATVKVNSIDSSFASENAATLTATLYDADGYVLDDYEAAECAITATAVPAATSDTNSALSVAKGASYTMKVTSTSAPTVTTGSNGVFSVALTSKDGNNYFYKLTATGDAGKATGVYLNGNKIFVATVKAFAFTSDTTKATTVKGAYTFKITADATPTVSVGGAAFKLTFVSKTGNAYLYTITSAGKAGAAAGVYVNGSKVFVATVG